MNQMDLFADEAAKEWASVVERETNTESLDLPEETSSSPVSPSSEAEENPDGGDADVPQDAVAGVEELAAPEDQADEGRAEAELPAEPEGPEAVASEFPEDSQGDESEGESRIAMGDQPDGGGLPVVSTQPAEPDREPPSLPDIEFPEDQQGQYRDHELPQDLRADYRDSVGEIPETGSGWQGSPGSQQGPPQQPRPIELPSDFDERLRFAIQPELDQLQDALGSRTSDILFENAMLASLSVVPE